MAPTSIRIARRFCGPPQSGNGGYVCGRLAASITGSASVRLKAPPPLDVEMEVREAGPPGHLQLIHASKVIAEAQPNDVVLTAPESPSSAEAAEASTRYSGFVRHAFPTCFVCGPKRSVGDGLRIFPGRVSAREMVAALWTPDASLTSAAGVVSNEFIWAALDCSSAFALPQPVPGKAIVLGELAVRIDRELRPDEPSIVMAWPIKTDGRKRFSGSAIYLNGDLIAVGAATWIEVEASVFGGL